MVIAALIKIESVEIPCRLVMARGEDAMVELELDVLLPQSFALEIPANVTVRRECTLISQNDGMAHVVLKALPNLRSHSDLETRCDL
jgi:hypothetical protein